MPLTAQPDATCEAVRFTADEEPVECAALSRFVVERDDDDTSYIPAESCENHLAEIVALMADGDDKVRLIVTIRWDAADDAATACTDTSAPYVAHKPEEG